MRAAARPVPVPVGYEGRAAQPQAPMPTVAEAQVAAAQAPLPVDVPLIVPEPGEAWPADAFSPAPSVDTPAQLAAFEPADAGLFAGVDDVARAAPDEPLPSFESAAPAEPSAPIEQERPSAWSTSASPGSSPTAPVAPAFLQGGAGPDLPDEPDALDDDAPVPGFLAGRTERAPAPGPRSSKPEIAYRETVSREDLVPSWELTGQYGADLNDEKGRRRGRMDEEGGGGGGDRFGGLITAVAVIAILALGVAGVIFLPGLLAGRQATTPSPAITAPPTGLGSPTLPVATVTPIASVGPTLAPTATPAPDVTPRLYRIKNGDTLGKIAKRFDVTVGDILAANPQITDPDHLVPGQVITIPQPTP
jgi:LysM repeat protein